MLCKKAAK